MLFVLYILSNLQNTFEVEFINECSCDSAREYMKSNGLDFSGGLCSSTNIDFAKINEMRCSPGHTLMVKDSLFQFDHNDQIQHESYYKRMTSEDETPMINFIGGSPGCRVEVIEAQKHLNPICVTFCKLQIENSLRELRDAYKITVNDIETFRKNNNSISCCNDSNELQELIKSKLKFRCAQGYEKEDESRSLGEIDYKLGSTDCFIERVVRKRLTTCVCTKDSCAAVIKKRHFVIGGKLPESFCKKAPVHSSKWAQFYCERGFELYDKFGRGGKQIKTNSEARVKMDGCEIHTKPKYAYCRKIIKERLMY